MKAVVPPVVGSVHKDIYGNFASDRSFNFAEVLAICINEVADSIILAPPDLEIITNGHFFLIARFN
jgi:hypothetical protein